MREQSIAGSTRRDFFKGAGVVGTAVLAGSLLGGCANEGADAVDVSDAASWLPESWNFEADIIVVGHGGAGLSAAITAVDEDLGSVVVLEAAPEDLRGGNSRVSGQNLLIPDDPEKAIEYQRALNDLYKLDEDEEKEQALYEVWANGLHENKEWLEGLGASMTPTKMNSWEFREIPAGETGGTCYLLDNIVGQSAVWNFLDETKESFGIEAHYDTRALKLVRNPLTNEALGVEADRGGEKILYKAKKGIVLACGGFENDPELMRGNIGLGCMLDGSSGSPFNRGDGFRMIAPFGAQLWHMNNVMGPSVVYSGCGADNWTVNCLTTFLSKDWIYVGPNGKRFTNEEEGSLGRHAKVPFGGQYVHSRYPQGAWTIFGKKCFEAGNIFNDFSMGWENVIGGVIGTDNQSYVENGVIIKGDTIEELAEKLDLDPAILSETISTYNEYCAAGKDADFRRGEPMEATVSIGNGMGLNLSSESHLQAEGFDLVPIEAPYYALKNRLCCINTQGGPKRGVGGEVMDVDGRPVPRLYAAGEFGPIYAYQYNGGGNFSEAIASGRLAARSIAALEPWDGSDANA